MHMRLFILATFIFFHSVTNLKAQETDPDKKWMLTITNGYNLGVQGSVLGTTTTRNADNEITGISNNSGSYGAGMSPGIGIDYLLTRNIAVGLAGEYLIGWSMTTNEDISDGVSLKAESKMRAVRVAPRITFFSEVTPKTSLFARVGADFVLRPVINETSNFSGDLFSGGDFDPDMIPPGFADFFPALDDVEINTTTRGNYSPGLMVQLGAQFRFGERLGMQVALDYRGYTFVTQSSSTEISGLGLFGSFLNLPYLTEVKYTDELNTSSNNLEVNPENVDFSAPRDELQQRFGASSLGVRIGLTVRF
jgi:hypothetical protein